MLKYLLVLVLFCSCKSTSSIFNKNPNTVVKKNGWLSVKNGEIINKDFQPPQLRGVSLSWSIWQGKKYYNTQVIDWLVKDFKVDLVRVSMAIEPKDGYLENPEEQKKLIYTVIDRAIANGVYVLIDWHDHHANLHILQAKAFFLEISKKYAGVPNVIYEIWNEPVHQSWEEIKKYALDVIPIIRKNSKQSLIIVGSPNWDQDVDITSKSPIVDYQNIAYSFHFYASDPAHQEKLRSKADFAKNKGLPIFVTEWGVGESDGNGVFDKEKTDKWLNWLENKKLSWAIWNVTDKKETTAILKPGASVKGNWTDADLTPCGQYVRKVLREAKK
jgi:endoglucanase